MLSEREHHVLTEIESHLAATSPTLARRMRRPSRTKGLLWAPAIASAVVGFALAVLMASLGLAGQALIILLLFSWPLGRRARLRLRGSMRRVRDRLPKAEC